MKSFVVVVDTRAHSLTHSLTTSSDHEDDNVSAEIYYNSDCIGGTRKDMSGQTLPII